MARIARTVATGICFTTPGRGIVAKPGKPGQKVLKIKSFGRNLSRLTRKRITDRPHEPDTS
ncbi:MAG: hypothetical protein GXP53_01850 [Deltaproteobacteria bacterium]|nr:hypothetical protein [Deltaproteobacteria bacterium]